MTSLSADIVRTADKAQDLDDFDERKREWSEIEELVAECKKQFEENTDEKQVEKSKQAASELLERFTPLFKKYLQLIKTGQVNFDDKETKLFVASFMDDPSLKRALKRRKQKAQYRAQIYQKFNFVKETYGSLSEDEILVDMQMIILKMAKRYKPMGRSFCAYVYNSFRHEMSRHIKEFTRNPINIPYKKVEYEDYMSKTEDQKIEECFEDKFYEDTMGIPDMAWIAGETCSDIFADPTPIERKILIKYYMEHWNDRQIAEEYGIHINTVNQKRRRACAKIAEKLGLAEDDIKRNRKSGKKAILPMD